ncbi:hypothetical protein [Staphylococcus phage SAP6]|uniref:Uncharacterized protein n=5 Tax=Silviavirus remus TaxID=1857890 RepID=S4T8W8_9CAUD|nr:hypothetical protein QLX36_gp006 [Staphylococcus phage vB_SauM_Romulus]YP_008431140.1 hypothetical protein O151_gp169 [Staphylococcus phage vB_SauM_Remus]QVD57663.1 hypothetical protein PM56_118 [Staphylococcus phage PM56]QVD58556.1 hypothetical protein PM93_129 [Staphylococcus phage PM93]QVD58759.1 hypothetical protein Remus_128 [Silviavirus remus]QVD58950.1 hypothetical protein Romulus_118 [Staphylococcus phage Romulus]WAW11935.1 hypothetical protein [Staphylococcus phage StAP1]WAW12150
MIGLNVLTAISVVFACVSLLALMVFAYIKTEKSSKLVLYLIYAIIAIGSYVVLTMFQATSIIIKNDVIDSIENTEQYVGFNNPLIVFGISFFGAVIGSFWFLVMKIVNTRNLKNKKLKD